MPFKKIEPEKLKATVARQIEKLILRGILKPGDRLPSERDLSEKMAVSRPILREAVSDLQERGLLQTRAGAGIFVADVLGSAFSEGLITLFASDDEAVFDYIAFRRDLEGLAAERAATLASDTDRAIIDKHFERMEAAKYKRNAEEDAKLDAEFHMAIIEAGHNVIMLHMMRSMFDLLRNGVFYNRQIIFRQKTARDTLLNQHRAINDAIQAQDAKSARHAVETHLDFVRDALIREQRRNKNETFAQLKLDQQG